jgi:simple sugar transport system ATP-binding protein/ribose transport system ATP-binding protein
VADAAPVAPGRAAHVELAGIAKQFGGVRALDGISMQIEAGTVHALVGENGAGKSTLAKIVAGAVSPDEGQVLIEGEPVSFRSPREALSHGIAMIAQELLVVPRLSVAENVFLGAEPRRLLWVRRRALRRRFDALAQDAGFGLPADRPAGRMRTAEQQQLEILRALARDARLIVMDEPSAALSGPDTTRLHEIIRSLARAGKTVLLVSHYLREVLELADTVTVLRDGRLVRSASTSSEREDSLIQGMLGRPLGAAFPPKATRPADAPVALSVEDLSAIGVRDASLEVREGEIVALAGLVGAGRTELARAIFGAARRTSGAVGLGGGRLRPGGPRASLRAGLAMIPESRKDEGLLFERSVVENVSLATLGTFSRAGIVNRRSERSAASEILDKMALKSESYQAPVASLSGGNQQKVLFARMLMCGPRVLIADEPTRGVDVGAKRAIYELLVSLAKDGMAVLLISSELEEIVGLAHRVLVMRRGRIVTELADAEITESAVLAAAFSEPTSEVSAA